MRRILSQKVPLLFRSCSAHIIHQPRIKPNLNLMYISYCGPLVNINEPEVSLLLLFELSSIP
jgi:hypothetical protein